MRSFALISPSILVAAASAVGLGLLPACSSTDTPAPDKGHAGAPAGGTAGGPAGGASAAGASAAGANSSAGMSGSLAGASSGGAGSGGTVSAAAGAPAAGAPSGGASNGGAAGAGVAGAAAGGAASACPADATFCSGFEVSTLPTGAVYKYNAAPGEWTRDFEVDGTLAHSGKSSLRVKSGSEAGGSGAYRMLAVPAPSGPFWVRFYIQQTELDLGGADHNVFASGAVSDDPNGASIEFAEDVGIAFNTSDAVRWPTGYGRLTSGGTMPYSLPKGMWHCIEISFDSQGKHQQLFINGMQQIDATDYPASFSGSLKNFKFGFNQLHGPARKVWYDDVAVAPSRIKCL
ncbi:MAG TPA: hypothetical protein VFK05_10765 [Polyangiaceae bacterium]|nr:hypothetical protein [Polyangiaceae bacterium]